MSKSGQDNFKGITYQAQAALLLFLLRLNENGFDSVTLEDKDWEDFTLNYRNGKKVICEVKNHARPLGVAQVKGILQNISSRDGDINETDEIIIVCNKVTEKLNRNLEYIKFIPQAQDEYRQLGFSDQQIDLLSKTSFFTAGSSEYLYEEASAYLYSYIGYWLPQAEIDGLLDSVLVRQIYDKSVKGETFTRTELSEAIEKYRKEKIKREVDYDSEQRSVEQQIDTLLTGDTATIKRGLTSITALPDRLFILLDKITESRNVKLEDWDFLWEAMLDRQFAFRVLYKFEKDRIQIEEDALYILGLLTSRIESITKNTVDRHHAEFALEIIKKIATLHQGHQDEVLNFCKAFLQERQSSYFELRDNTGSMHEKQLISNLLYSLFQAYEDDNQKVEELLKLIDAHFDLVGDDGDLRFFIYTPRLIFDLLREYLSFDFKTNFDKIKQLFINQYKKSKYYGGKFSGWEVMGGSFSQSGDNYTIDDRHFIVYTLKPALREYYKKDPKRGWTIIIEDWISRKESDVSEDRPDFLNRAAIDILLDEYASTEHDKEAFHILSDFILTRKGIPAKFECVFQAARNNSSISDDKKWELVKVFLGTYSLPHSVFIEQIASGLALQGYREALQAIRQWVSNPEYRKGQNRRSFLLGDNMLKLLDTTAGSESYKTGVEILKTYLNTDDYRQDLGNFDAYGITNSITKVITNNVKSGLEILWDIYHSRDELTNNQQVAICNSVAQLDKENVETLLAAYEQFVRPVIFDDLKADIKLIEDRFNHKYARELLVQFSEKLTEVKLFQPALDLVKVFIADKDPGLENDPSDPNGDFNYHARIIAGDDSISINTVRGWCAWTLGRFATLYGRDYLPEVVDMVKELSEDSNFYVRVQATLALSGLVQNRHTVLPNNDKERFISLKLAQKIEDIVFAMLRDQDNQKHPIILKHLAHVFGYMRSMSEGEAWEVLTVYKNFSFEKDIDDIYPLFVFFALFRKKTFVGKRYKDIFGPELYDKIAKFDDTRFKGLLKDLIRNGSSDIRGRLAWQFWQLPKENPSEFEDMFTISLRYLTLLTETYDKHAFDEIYYFINDNLDRKPVECIDLWNLAIRREKDYLNQSKDKLKPYEWWPNHFNGEVLAKIKEIRQDSEFLESFGVLLDYPEQFDAGIAVDAGYIQLKSIADNGDKQALELKRRLMDLYPRLYNNER